MGIHQNPDLLAGSGTVYFYVPDNSKTHQVEIFGSGSIEVFVLSADNDIKDADFDLTGVSSTLWHAPPDNTGDLSNRPFYKKIRAKLSGFKIVGGSYQYRITSSDE